MAERTVLITGGTSGLGLRAAAELASDPSWHVVVTGRDAARTRTAAARVDAEPELLDLASLEDVGSFAGRLAAGTRPPLHALVCNAGIQIVSGLTFTPDGFERTFAVNHLGHFLLVNLLLGRLTEPARIVFVTSGTHDPARRTGMPSPRYTDARSLAHPEAEGRDTSGDGRLRYTTSKLCNVLTAYELARRLEGRESGKTTVNAFDPGLMPGSGLARDSGPVQRFAWRYLMPALTLLPINAHTTRSSGKALARLVADPALEGVSGKYFEGTRDARSSIDSYNTEIARELWKTSAELVHLDSH